MMRHLSSSTTAKASAALIALVTVVSTAAQAAEEPTALSTAVENVTPITSARLESPLSVSGALNFPLVNLGIDVSYHLTDRFAVGGQLTTMLAATELTARTRFFFLARPRWGLYLGANALLLHSPLLFSFPAIGATGEVGVESRPGSWVLGFGAGAGAVWAETAEGAGPDEHWHPYPVVNLRIGRAYRRGN